jgi:hypothetical protein
LSVLEIEMRATVVLLTGFATVVSCGLVHGFWTNRWQSADQLEIAATLLDRVTTNVDSWHGELLTVDPRDTRLAGISRCVMHRYTRDSDKASASIVLMCGRAGPMAVHTPEYCYRGTGYEMEGAPVRHVLAGHHASKSAEFFTARFKKANTGVPSYLRVYWSWKAPTSFWHAPNNARLAFAGTSVLFKLYVIREMATPDERPENDPSVELMSRFLAELKMEQF